MERCTARINWKTGLYVTSQHFQLLEQREIFNEQNNSKNNSFHWGIRNLEYDKELFEENKFLINKATIYFKNGTHITIPDNAKMGTSVSFEDSLEKDDEINVEVGIKNIVNNDSFLNVDNKDFFTICNKKIKDENDNSEKVVELKMWSVKVFFSQKNSETKANDYEILKIGEITKKNKDKSIYNNNYIPPIVRVSDHETFINLFNDICKQLEKNQDNLFRKKCSNPHEILNIIRLQSVNKAIGILDQLYQERNNIHPFQVYIELIRIVSDLQTFSPKPIDKIEYKHDDLKNSMDTLTKEIERHLSWKGLSYTPKYFVFENEKLVCHITKEMLSKEFNNSYELYLCIDEDLISDIENIRGYLKYESIILSPLNETKYNLEHRLDGIKREKIENVPYDFPQKGSHNKNKNVYLKLESSDKNWNELSNNNPLEIKFDSGNEKYFRYFENPEIFSIFIYTPNSGNY